MAGELTDWGRRGPPWRGREAREARGDGDLPGGQLAPFPGLENSIGARPDVPPGELPGARATRDKLIAQEIAGGCRPDVAVAQVDRVLNSYDRSVRTGQEPPPLKRD